MPSWRPAPWPMPSTCLGNLPEDPSQMPGRNTSLNGLHPSRGGLVPDYKCSPPLLAALVDAIGRPLAADEVACIAAVIGLAQYLRSDHFRSTVDRQDVIRTLGAIAAANDDNAARMAEDCDGTTDNLLHCVIWTSRNAITVQQAAGIALARFRTEDAKPGRRVHRYQHQLAADAIALWRRLGGGSEAIFANDAYSPPLLRWAVALLSEVEGRAFDRVKAERLLKPARNEFDGM